MNVYQWVEDAYQRISPLIRKTPLEYSSFLSEQTGANVYLKQENLQITGSFKARGGLNKVLSLSSAELEKGVITASTGNHAAAVANAVDVAGGFATIYMPETVSKTKVENLKQYKNIKVELHGQDSVEAELEASRVAKSQGLIYISPYNDEEIIGGQGTIAKEILEDLADVSTIFVPIGGGGLISGIGGFAKNQDQSIEIIGCQPENSAVMYHSIQAGKVLEMSSEPTVSDGTAGGMEVDSITFPICQKVIDRFHLISENEIINALGILIKHHFILAEGAAGLAVASLIKNKELYQNKNVVLILCGNKMTVDLLKKVTAVLS
jgi:threonine dehydratase